MGRIIKLLLFLIVAGLIGLAGFAYLGNLEPMQKQVTEPVTLDVN